MHLLSLRGELHIDSMLLMLAGFSVLYFKHFKALFDAASRVRNPRVTTLLQALVIALGIGILGADCAAVHSMLQQAHATQPIVRRLGEGTRTARGTSPVQSRLGQTLAGASRTTTPEIFGGRS